MRAILLGFLLLPALYAQTEAEATFWRTLNDGRDSGLMLFRYLRGKAGEALERRAERVRNTRDWDAYRREFREKLLTSLGGPFPAKAPLNASVVATLQRDGYRIEKVIFESHPKFFVTANLYLPATGNGPFPAILFPLGHETGAKAHGAWQMVLANLARRGFVLLAWDPVGQGERVQLYDEDFKASKLVQSTTEHTIQGLQALLVGDAMARYTIWDGIRALDYLLSRPEVDKTRVGITGNSGGGTHTSYIGSLEDRIHVAAPSCYITSWGHLLDTIGPQDAEQVFPGWLAAGYDHPDFIYAFSPKPFLMLSAIRDFFSIEGARSTYAEASRVYDSLGVAAKFGKFEADDGHGYTQPRREAAYRWFTKWLKGAEDMTPESPVQLLSETEANCTPTGQLATSLKGHTVHSLNLARWRELRKPGSLDDVKRLTGFQARLDGVKARSYGTLAVAPGIVAEKYLLEPEKGIVLPALLYRGEGAAKKEAVILAHGRGKVAVRAEALALAKSGKVVLAVDLRGMGETSNGHRERSGDWSRYLGDYESAQIAFLLNKPLVGMRAEDVSAAVTFLAGRADVDAAKIRVHAFEGAAVPALHAMAMDTRIVALTVERMVQSYESIIRGRIHRGQTENIVVGALRHYDLPDLINWSSPRKVTGVEPLNPLGQPVTP